MTLSLSEWDKHSSFSAEESNNLYAVLDDRLVNAQKDPSGQNNEASNGAD
jgi:hypothetical protein